MYQNLEFDRNKLSGTTKKVREDAYVMLYGDILYGQLPIDKVLKSAVAPGNYNDDNLVNENVRNTKAYGVGGVGTLIEESHTAADLDKPTANHVTENDTTGLVTGEIPLSDVMPASGGTSDKLYSAAEEIARNTISKLKVLLGWVYKHLGADVEGAYAGVSAPTAPVLAATVISSTRVRLTWTYGANASNLQPKYKTVGGSYGNFGSALTTYTVDVTGLTAGTAYVFKIMAHNGAGDTDSNEVTVTTNASTDCIASLITASLVTAEAAVTTANGYNTNVAYCEQERLTDRKNDRYPMVTVAGPYQTFDPDVHARGTEDTLEYTLFYEAQLDDRDTDGEPLAQQADNVAADLIKGFMVDRRRNEYAINTSAKEAFYTVDYTKEDNPIFVVVVTLEVKTILDAENPYQNG